MLKDGKLEWFEAWRGSEDKITQNKWLCSEFPFLIKVSSARDDARSYENYDFTTTWLDEIPEGWIKRFGYELCVDLRDYLEANNLMNDYYITSISEKFGTLRIRANIDNENLWNIYDKYEQASSETCIRCGKLVRIPGLKWNIPICKECKKKMDNIQVKEK